jgi:hypothetical protein
LIPDNILPNESTQNALCLFPIEILGEIVDRCELICGIHLTMTNSFYAKFSLSNLSNLNEDYKSLSVYILLKMINPDRLSYAKVKHVFIDPTNFLNIYKFNERVCYKIYKLGLDMEVEPKQIFVCPFVKGLKTNYV